MNKKHAIVASFAAALIFLFAACSNPNDGSTLPTLAFEDQLRSLPNVESVEPIKEKSDFKGTVYKVYFKSQLDPADISKGTFRQKAFVGFAGYDKPNCLMTTGYSLSDKAALKRLSENEAAYILEGNLVAVEHRYFGDSVRTDKKREDGGYDGIFVPFLGKMASTPTGPAYFARKFKAPCINIFIIRKPDGYGHQVFVEEPFYYENTGDQKADDYNLTLKMTRSVEKIIRKYPENWLWFQHRWNTPYEEVTEKGQEKREK